jgi:hypothetical protein
MTPRIFLAVLSILVAAIVILSGAGYAQYQEKLHRPQLNLDALYFKLETNLDINTTTVKAELYLQNTGQKDALELRVEMVAVNRSVRTQDYRVYINKTSADIPDVAAGKTVISDVTMDLPPGLYTMELRIYMHEMRVFTAKRDITLSKEMVQEEGRLSQNMIPEFGDIALPLAGCILFFLLARRAGAGRDRAKKRRRRHD